MIKETSFYSRLKQEIKRCNRNTLIRNVKTMSKLGRTFD